jgi:hypothetical protein
MTIIEGYTPTFHYKPGKENVGADALYRQFMNHNIDNCSDEVTVHSEQSSSRVIKSVPNPKLFQESDSLGRR